MTSGRTPRATLAAALAFAASILALPALAADLDFDLSNSAAHLDYRFSITDTGLDADLGLLHHDDDGDVLHAGIILVGDAAQGAEPFTAGLGARAIVVDANVIDGTGIAIGGFFRYVMPDFNRFAIGGYAYLAPSVTSFGDLDRYMEFGVRGEYRVLDKASVYLGLRDVSADFAGFGDATVDDGLHVGISLEF